MVTGYHKAYMWNKLESLSFAILNQAPPMKSPYPLTVTLQPGHEQGLLDPAAPAAYSDQGSATASGASDRETAPQTSIAARDDGGRAAGSLSPEAHSAICAS